MSSSADPTDDFIAQLEALRPLIRQAMRRGERVRIKLYAADTVGPPEFRSLYSVRVDRHPSVMASLT